MSQRDRTRADGRRDPTHDRLQTESVLVGGESFDGDARMGLRLFGDNLLAEGYYDGGYGFGRDLVRDLRRLIERVHDGEGGDTPAVNRLMDRIKGNCQRNRDGADKKVRELAGEILNDWAAVVAFVFDPTLPPTNNDAERALRHAVIARRISFGTRTDEGSRFYAAALSVIDTCRKRGVETWSYAAALIADARAGLRSINIPIRAVA